MRIHRPTHDEAKVALDASTYTDCPSMPEDEPTGRRVNVLLVVFWSKNGPFFQSNSAIVQLVCPVRERVRGAKDGWAM